MSKMLGRSSILKVRRLIHQAQLRNDLTDRQRGELAGVSQALGWVLCKNCMNPAAACIPRERGAQ